MAEYTLKYYKDIPQADGSVIRLDIYREKQTTDVPVVPIDGDIVINPELASTKEIGAVIRGLHLNIQGETGEVDTPIVKTSLTMVFADAPDITNGKKNGGWEEFYVASSTEWKVILKEKSPLADVYSTIWGGYITPDSFSEDLSYHGNVTLIARDNLGHLQDFPFDAGDADGMVSLFTIVASALAKIESPMDYDFFGDGGNGGNDVTHWLKCKDKPLYDARMNVSFFEGMNYYEALEKALYALGCVMRYVGRNRFYICPLRDMPKHGYFSYDYFATKAPVLINGATRELVPACKMIEEVDKYELEDTIPQIQVGKDDFTGTQTTYRCKIDGVTIDGTSFGRQEQNAPVWAIKNTGSSEGWNNVRSSSLCFDISRYGTGYFTTLRKGDAEMRRYMYLAANNVDTRAVQFRKSIMCAADCSVTIKFGAPICINSASLLEVQSVFGLKAVTYSIRINVGDATFHYAGEGRWVTTEKKMTKTYDPQAGENVFEETIGMSEDVISAIGAEDYLGTMDFFIHKIEYMQLGYAANLTGLYACIQELSIGIPKTTSLMESNTIKTIYNEGNNVILKRDPELAPTHDAVFTPSVIKNGIFIDYITAKYPARDWVTSEGFTAELPVHIHKQLLCYHAKPNNLISGTIVNSGTMGLSCNWLWRGKEHILMSGSLNLINGHMEGAVLREFKRYEDMWKEEPPLYFENLSEGAMSISFSTNDVEYSTNGKTWQTLTAGGTTPSVGNGEKIYFRASGLTPTSSSGIGAFSSNAECKVGGNAMSMIYGAAYANKVVISEAYAFNRLFLNMTKLKDASGLILPATTLSSYCYNAMFRGCSSLESAPKLPATTLSPYCYNGMFLGCSSLVDAPELPATNLVSYCYNAMFLDCTKLAYIKALFLTEPSASYTNTWLSNVAKSGTFIKNKDATWSVTGVNGVPSGWVVRYNLEIH